MNRLAILFPGQGSQSVGMVDDLAAEFPLVRDTFDDAGDAIDVDLWKIATEDPDGRLDQTEITQPAMLAADIATWRCWRKLDGPEPDFVAGHSLGEYAALVAAGQMKFRDAIQVVAARGRFMQQATPEAEGSMAAVLGLDDSTVTRICAEATTADEMVSCANFNAPGQVVIAGHRPAVERAMAAARDAGAKRVLELPVSVPAHCALMKPAADELAEVLGTVELRPAEIPVLHNIDAGRHEGSQALRAALVAQVWQPVRWSETIDKLTLEGVGRFAESGPGKVLAGLNRRNARDAETVALVGPERLRETIERWAA